MANYMKVYSKKDLKNIDGVWYEYEKDKPVVNKANGVLRTIYPTYGAPQDETPIENGVNNGVQKVFDSSGSLWYENTWKDGTLIKFRHIA